jgi:hydrogenase expression/formation protein HypC
MCLGVPGRLIAVFDDGETGLVDLGGATDEVSLALLEGKPQVGDWVAVHMGFATECLSAQEAADVLGALVTIGPGVDAVDEQTLLREWGLIPALAPESIGTGQ